MAKEEFSGKEKATEAVKEPAKHPQTTANINNKDGKKSAATEREITVDKTRSFGFDASDKQGGSQATGSPVAASPSSGTSSSFFNTADDKSTKDSFLSYGSADPAETPPETTAIAKGTKLVGDIETSGNLRIGGSVKGNVIVNGTLSLNGQIIGDIKTKSVEIAGSVVKGNVVASDHVSVDKETTIIGNVTAREGEIGGRIKGNLSMEQRVHIQESAILVGNLGSGSVHIEEGAMLKGDVTITQGKGVSVQVEEPEFDIHIENNNRQGGQPASAPNMRGPVNNSGNASDKKPL